MKPVVQFRMRIRKGPHVAIGPGKVALLEAIGDTGSITAAAKSLDMSYRRAWLLVDEMNTCMRHPVVETATGGVKGGGSLLTPIGREIITRYRAIQAQARTAVTEELEKLLRLLA
ncbi:MAG: winged helix-turn-helix domain-containing protein [Betaproteobacteria bacterium]